MKCSIVFTGKYHVGISESKYIEVNGQKLSVEKDIPFVRFRFEAYGEEEMNFIDEQMNRFKDSAFLIEIPLDCNTSGVLTALGDRANRMAKYIYTNVTDTDVENKRLQDEAYTMLNTIKGFNIDRLMLKDKSTKLDAFCAKAIIKTITSKKDLGIKEDDIGICSSPLSFGKYACLTAEKARELMSIYTTNEIEALPSANHQCMNCCGCIRYFLIESDLPAPIDTKTKGRNTKKKNETGNKDSELQKKASQKPKSTLQIGQFRL